MLGSIGLPGSLDNLLDVVFPLRDVGRVDLDLVQVQEVRSLVLSEYRCQADDQECETQRDSIESHSDTLRSELHSNSIHGCTSADLRARS